MPLTGNGKSRLLAGLTRITGVTFVGLSLLALLLPDTASIARVSAVLPLYALMTAAFLLIGRTRSLLWSVVVLVLGVVAIVFLGHPSLGSPTEATASAIVLLAAGALPALIVCNLDSPRRIGFLVVGFLVIVPTVIASVGPAMHPLASGCYVVVGWATVAAATAWLTVSVSRALARIARLSRAHLAERQASEIEAQRRQGARLLHDTVLATLTLLAHSGVGVGPDALRTQSAEDARLLRQLRLGGTPMPSSSGAYTLEATETSDLGHTLESVKQRFDRMGLTVSWHGAGRILLPSDVLDAFLLSLAECLENVRRHSGVDNAEVTITQDDTTVRAMVTDTGVGFDLDQVDSARLGLAESVVARIRDAGGRTRLFSAPGSGTTVVLEVPKL